MKQITINKLTNKDQYIIAEYIYSYQQDILIKSDAKSVIKMFNEKGIDTSEVELEAHAVMNLIRKHIGSVDRNMIMEQYYSNAIN